MRTTKFFSTVRAKLHKAKMTAINLFTMLFAYMYWQMNAFAFSINTKYTIKSSVAEINPESLILGISFWICRLMGVGMIVWGIVGYITARKNSESDAMNTAQNTAIGGFALVCMPSILQAIGII